MSKFRLVLSLVLVSGIAFPALATAQQRLVTGTVVAAVDGQPIAGAGVSAGFVSTRTDAQGRFSVEVPAGPIRLVFRAIGYARQEVDVAPGQSSVAVRLTQDIFQLDEVIVTGQATQVDRRSATTAVGFVTGDEVRSVATPTFEAALNGRVTGVNIQSNSGAPGGGMQLQIRGNTTILGSADPLFVVDGVIYSNAMILGGRSSAVAGASVSEDDPINRVADVNPNDIASIEILKGAAASSIYGSKASNGVVIINTSRGREGAPRVTLIQRFGTFDLQRKYESRTFTAAEVEDAVGIWGEAARPFFANGTPQTFDSYEEVFGRNGLSYETAGTVSGGSETTRYFLSGTWKRDEGLAANTGFSRQGLRVNVDQALGDKVEVSVSSVFNRSLAQRGFTNNGNNGGTAGYALAYQPNFQSLLPNEQGVFTDPALSTQGPGANPVQTHELSSNDAETNRFTGGATLTYDAIEGATSSVRITAAAGVDIFNQADAVFTPPDLFFERVQTLPGTAVEQSAVSRLTNWNANVVHTFRPGAVEATTAAGIQFEDRQLHRTRVTNTNLIPGQSNVNQGTSPVVAEQFTKERTLAFYLQESMLMLDERLLLTGGLRAERSSANGDPNKYYVFPKLSGSYRFTDVGVLGAGGEFKLRAAYGETGNQPLFGQKFTTLNTPQFGGTTGFTVAGAAGAPNVTPERLKEVEVGFDATMFNQRAQLEFSFYTRNTTNLLLQRVPAPSTGFTSEVFNGGKVRNQGVEAGLGITPVLTRDLTIISRATFTLNRNQVMELPVASFRPPLSGFGGLGVTFIEEGEPMTQIVGFDFDANGDRAAQQSQLGNSAPDFRMGFANDIGYRAIRLNMVWDWQQGGEVINLTQFLYDDAQNAADFGSPEHAYRMSGYNLGVMTPYIEDATFLKLRELSLGVRLPQSLVDGLFGSGVENVDLSVTGRNLLLFTKYSGLDPEVANFGATAIRNNLDITPYPPSRSVFFNIQIQF